MFDVVVTFQVGNVVCVAAQWADTLLDVGRGGHLPGGVAASVVRCGPPAHGGLLMGAERTVSCTSATVQLMPVVTIRQPTESTTGFHSLLIHQPGGASECTRPVPARCTHAPSLLTLAPSQDKETSHRVIVGRDYYEPQGIDPQVRRNWAAWRSWLQVQRALLDEAGARLLT